MDGEATSSQYLHPANDILFRFPAATALTLVIGLVFGAGHVARADALVGKTVRMAPPPLPAPAFDRLKAEYAQPDTIPFPADNRYTREKASLGRTLYFDTRLSRSGALGCASCHNPGFAYGDGRAKAVGEGMRPLERRSPSLVNAAWGNLFMWDGTYGSLEEQALAPIESATEMDMPPDRLVQVLSGISGYAPLFAAAFPHQAIAPATVAEAIATYERTIVSAEAPFDAWLGGDDAAIPAAAKRGFALFNGKARCALCHSGWTFTDDGFHDTGLPDDDVGRGRLLPRVAKMQHAFKTPGLREIARRGPYMHDGSLATLGAVVAHYDRGGIDRPSKSELLGPLGLTPDEQVDIVAFLQTLTSQNGESPVPAMPQ